jgi:hypothetical protein
MAANDGVHDVRDEGVAAADVAADKLPDELLFVA